MAFAVEGVGRMRAAPVEVHREVNPGALGFEPDAKRILIGPV
jgi:hypothetical protein